MKRLKLLAAVAALTCVSAANAAIFGVTGGAAAPGATLGGYAMTPFADDVRAVFTNVNSVASPLGGSLGFSSLVNLREIGNGWATWSHGYTGDVYYTNGLDSITLTLPALTAAFYFYVESNSFDVFTFTATSGATQVVQDVDGNGGASYFGFYGTGGDTIDSITISASSQQDFAIGEFGIAQGTPRVPDAGATLGLLGGALLVLVSLRRRNS